MWKAFRPRHLYGVILLVGVLVLRARGIDSVVEYIILGFASLVLGDAVLARVRKR